MSADIRSLEEDTDAPDDGKVLIAGVLYDAVTGEEVEEECEHLNVESDDDGTDWRRRTYVCTDCEEVVVPTEPDEDGITGWEVMT